MTGSKEKEAVHACQLRGQGYVHGSGPLPRPPPAKRRGNHPQARLVRPLEHFQRDLFRVMPRQLVPHLVRQHKGQHAVVPPHRRQQPGVDEDMAAGKGTGTEQTGGGSGVGGQGPGYKGIYSLGTRVEVLEHGV